MTERFPTQSLDEFLRRLLGSQLLDDAVVKSALNDFRSMKIDNRPSEDARTFASYLVIHGHLTCWQAEKIRAGRYKGFFMDGYKLLALVDYDDNCSRFLAEDTDTGRLVILALTPRTLAPLKNGMPQYEVEHYSH